MKLTYFGMSLALCSLLGGQAALASRAGGAASSACRKEFFDAKNAGTLNGQKYRDFKKEHCAAAKKGKSVAKEDAPAAPTAAPAPAAAPATPTRSVSSAAPIVASGNAVFPDRISAEFANLPAGKGRFKTCLAQYNANKTTGRNGGLEWIKKGGGYYSECNTRLKGAAQ